MLKNNVITQMHDTYTTFMKKVCLSPPISLSILAKCNCEILSTFSFVSVGQDKSKHISGKKATAWQAPNYIFTTWVSVCHHFQFQTNCFIMALKNCLTIGHSESSWRVSKYSCLDISPSPFLSNSYKTYIFVHYSNSWILNPFIYCSANTGKPF